jgi:hypothetical protein
MWRSILSVVVGVIAAVLVVGLLEAEGHLLYPPPPDINLHDSEQLRAIVDRLPLGALLSVLVAWGAGSLAGGFVAAAMARNRHLIHALIVGCVQMMAGIVTMVIIPHPMWFMIASIVILLPAACLGAWLAGRFTRRPPKGPQPYDMREKNMAC